MADLKALADAVIRGDQDTTTKITKAALDDGLSPESILNKGLIAAMDVIGDRFSKNEIYIPEMLIAARAMKSAMEVLEPELVKAGVEPIGKFLIGTVQGDLHDIGKNLVAMMLKGAGFEVIDLGIDVAAERFVEQAKAAHVQSGWYKCAFDNDDARYGENRKSPQKSRCRRQNYGRRCPHNPELCRQNRRRRLCP